jgi:molybdopterin molybdotransferase
MIPPQEAWERLAAHLKPLSMEAVPRSRAAGRVLAKSLVATVDVPAQDVSAMDGYAIAAAVATGDRLPVVGTVSAGDPPGFELAPGDAVRIMTGAPVPAAAERVVPVELTNDSDTEVEFHRDPGPKLHIRRRAEILAAGAPLLPQGALLTPGALSLLATHGYGEVPVHRTPRVAVVVTGDEVVPPESVPLPGQLRDSHTDFLLPAVASVGAEATALGIAPDDVAALRARIEEGMGADVLLLTGGVSMGKYDLVEGVLEDLGCTILFEKVAVQPAKPVVAAIHPGGSGGSGGLIFGLPGNPASAMVAFWLFVRPALRRLMGWPDAFWHGALEAELAAPLPGAKGRDRFLPATVRFAGGRILATPHPPVGSHDLAAYACGTGLVRIPAHSEPRPPGERCQLLPLGEWRGV